jgi:phosphosulfolactate synthase (CoM biosynthesis protein A)
MEQPAGLLRKMRQVNNVYDAFKIYKREGTKPGESAKWKREHEDVWDIVNEVERLRAKYG